ncbi:MAG: hypothetical protein H6739_18555 [Alphaproteobacteria bacterium]|nr:hypothetical protein [Alphaproteobacteria bacterium]
MPRPPLEVVDEAPQGCLEQFQALGLAMYASIVLAMLLGSAICAIGSMVGLLLLAENPKELTSGTELEVWRLAVLRDQGVLGDDQVPALYHDHSEAADGSAGCLVVDGALVRWQGGAIQARSGFADAEVRVDGPDATPTVTLVTPDLALACPFGEGEGGDRFARMLQSEVSRTR